MNHSGAALDGSSRSESRVAHGVRISPRAWEPCGGSGRGRSPAGIRHERGLYGRAAALWFGQSRCFDAGVAGAISQPQSAFPEGSGVIPTDVEVLAVRDSRAGALFLASAAGNWPKIRGGGS